MNVKLDHRVPGFGVKIHKNTRNHHLGHDSCFRMLWELHKHTETNEGMNESPEKGGKPQFQKDRFNQEQYFFRGHC